MFPSRLAVFFAQPIEARCSVGNEDVVGAAPTGDAPTTSEWSTIMLSAKVRLILEIWRYVYLTQKRIHDKGPGLINFGMIAGLPGVLSRFWIGNTKAKRPQHQHEQDYRHCSAVVVFWVQIRCALSQLAIITHEWCSSWAAFKITVKQIKRVIKSVYTVQ